LAVIIKLGAPAACMAAWMLGARSSAGSLSISVCPPSSLQ
jgi:hypothetical protein